MTSTARKITRNFLYLSLSQGISLGASFLMLAFLARLLSIEEFGAYGVIVSVASILLPLPYAGMTRILEREIAKNPEKSAYLLGSSLALRVVLSGVLVGACWSLRGLIPAPEKYLTAAAFALVWLVLCPIASAFTEYFVAIEKTEYEIGFNIVYKGVMLVGVIILGLLGWGLPGVFLAKAISRFVQTGAMWWFVARRFVRPQVSFEFAVYKMFLVEGWPLEVSEFLQMVFFKIDELILGLLAGAGQVGFFHGPYQIVLGMSLLPIQMMRSAFPAYARAFTNSMESFQDGYRKGFQIMVTFALPLTVALFAGAEDIVLLLMGQRFEDATLALRVLSISVPLVFAEVFLRFILASMGKQHYDSQAMLLGVIVNVVLDALLIPWFGFLGACLGTVSAQGILVLLAFYLLGREFKTLPRLRGLGLPLGATATLALLLWLYRDTSFWLVGTVLLGGYFAVMILAQRDLFTSPQAASQATAYRPEETEAT